MNADISESNQRQSNYPQENKSEEEQGDLGGVPSSTSECEVINMDNSNSTDTLPAGDQSYRSHFHRASHHYRQREISHTLRAIDRQLKDISRTQTWILRTQRYILSRIRTLESAAEHTPFTTTESSIELPRNPISTPVRTRVDLQQLNVRLRNAEVRKQLTSYLLCLGGRNVDDFVRKTFYAIFDDDITEHINFKGRKTKDSLGGSAVYDVITDVYRKWCGQLPVDLRVLESAFTKRLKRSLDACGKRLQRLSRTTSLNAIEQQTEPAVRTPIQSLSTDNAGHRDGSTSPG